MVNIQENITVAMKMIFNAGGFRQANKSFNDLIQTQRTGIGLTNKQIQGIAKTKQEFVNMNKSVGFTNDLAIKNKKSLQDMFDGTLPGMVGWNKVMGMSVEELNRFNKNGTRGITTTGRLANRVRLMTHGLRGFRMEMLGVMFFGMAMSQMFSSMLRPAADTLGIFDLWTTTLQVLFLPILISILPHLLNFMNWIMNLSPETKKVIGIITILGLIVGKVLMIIGMMALGLGSLFQTGLLKPILSVFSGITISALILFSVLAVIALGIYLAFKENFGNIRDWIQVIWEGIKDIINGAMLIIKSIIGIVISLIKGDWDGFKIHFINLWKGALKFIGGILKTIYGLFVTMGLGILKIIVNIVVMMKDAFLDFLSWVGDWAIKVVDSIWSKFPSWMKKLIQGTLNLVVNVKEKFSGGDDDGGSFNDFVSRPGQAPFSVNPNDTLIGFKGDGSNIFGGGINITQNISVTGTLKEELDRLIKDANDNLVNDIKRLSGA